MKIYDYFNSLSWTRILVVLMGLHFTCVLTGCNSPAESSIDINQLIESTEIRYMQNKVSIISEMSLHIKEALVELESICSQMDATEKDSLKICEDEIYSLRKQFGKFKAGDWDELPKLTFEEYSGHTINL